MSKQKVAQWRKTSAPLLRQLSDAFKEKNDATPDVQESLIIETIARFKAEYEKEVEEAARAVRAEMGDGLTAGLWDAIRIADIHSDTVVAFAKRFKDEFDNPRFAETAESLEELNRIMNKGALGALVTSALSEKHDYYIIETKDSDGKGFHVWPGHGRFSENLRRVFHSEVFKASGLNSKKFLDDKGVVKGKMNGSGTFIAYTKEQFVSTFGSDKYSQILAQNDAK